MESSPSLSGFEAPFQRRLSRLYNDTKKSTDFVKEPVQAENDPDTKAVHRKLRIQKDRLVSWGIDWSDPNQSAEIDESLARAGLSEVVGSIMSTIKDILADAEAMWLSSRRVAEGPRPSPDWKPPLAQWDKGRFDDLLRDLASSIDTLYDLSRTRSLGPPRRLSKAAAASFKPPTDEFRPFESSRMQTPQNIDPCTLVHLLPAGDVRIAPAPDRSVVFMSKTAYSELTQRTVREPWAPLLLEYATFDSIYATTGIMPPMARFERLSAGLQQDSQRAPGAWTGLPRLLGYFEDMASARLGLVYRFPPSFNPVSPGPLAHNPRYRLPSLKSLISAPNSEPALEAKFRLAHNLANTVFDMHARGVTHGNLSDTNISFCYLPQTAGGAQSPVDIRRPLVSSFDLFPQDESPAATSIWRHRLDSRNPQSSPHGKSADERAPELYSLAMILLSIGLWTGIEHLAPELAAGTIPQPLMSRLAVRCGGLYAKAVQACCLSPNEAASDQSVGDALLTSVQVRVSRYLEACCIIDGVNALEDRLTQELHPVPTPETRPQPESPVPALKPPSPYPTSRKVSVQEPAMAAVSSERAYADADADGETPPRPASAAGGMALAPAGGPSAPAPKMRIYPNVPLAPDAVEKWNSILMPQINHALRHFYRKHPESVEISLESVGPSPNNTQPTVLVVCTSVAKVRAILTKRLGGLFDGTTGFSLKVCRGHVVRSRRPADVAEHPSTCDALRGSGDGLVSVNPEFQPHPENGASIGAWIGDRHLPPVSLGGLIIVDDKPYGMTVHHMLDDPGRDTGLAEGIRSSARPGGDCPGCISAVGPIGDDPPYLSDTESEACSETDITSDYGDEDDGTDMDEFEPGDIPGVEPGCGDGYVVTQPALDDVEDGFYPCPETEDEDHIDTYRLGEIWASSGIRRRQANGLVHEVDWALFEFADGRLPDDNSIPLASTGQPPRRECGAARASAAKVLLRPTTVAASASLPGTEVQCVARTSGLQLGHILPALTSIKIFGRASPSHTYQVTSRPCSSWDVPMGTPGDSGAWVVNRHSGQLCGHVLAWSQRKQVAYICPMDVLLLDVAEALVASEIRLPGGEPIVAIGYPGEGSRSVCGNEVGLVIPVGGLEATPGEGKYIDDDEDEYDDENGGEPPQLAQSLPNMGQRPEYTLGGIRGRRSWSPMRLETRSELRGFAGKLADTKTPCP